MQKTYDIIGKFKFVILIPIIVIITGIFFNIFVGTDLSIEFEGGSSITCSYKSDLDLNKVKGRTEKALSDVGNTTELYYSYTGTVDPTTVEQAFTNKSFKDFSATSKLAIKDKTNYIIVSAAAKKFLTNEQISEITSLLTSTLSSNNVKQNEKLINKIPYVKTTVEVLQSTDFTTNTQNFKINVIGNISLSASQIQAIENSLKSEFPDNNINKVESSSVGKTFGSLFFGKSLYAVLIASILVVIYVGWRFRKVGGIKAGISALVALVHDLSFIYFIDVIFGIQIDTNFIAVFLTILGYSLNDTIVVYDRLRENSDIYGDKKTIRELMNISISQSLKRTFVTSATTFAAIMSVTVVAALRGLDSILTFAIPMSIGVVCGTFSSLFVAGPIYVFWCEHQEKKQSKDKSKGSNSKSADYTNRINPKNKRKKVY